MRAICKIFVFCALATFSSIVIGQTVCPTTPNFMDLNSPCVVCNYGKTWNLFSNTGLANTRHTLITTQGFDPNTGNKLPLIPEGDTMSIRLGNSQIGAEAEAITYHFEVQPDVPLLAIKFAVVFEDPGHWFSEQPRFIVRVLDDVDRLINPCAEYDITAAAGIPGFETYNGNYTPIRWRPWSTIAVDLSAYIGKSIKVQFFNYDCNASGHFGYAYFTAECISNSLNLTVCKGDTIRLSAPPFCEYVWTNGDTTANTMYIMKNPTLTASCLIKSFTGCEITLNAYLSEDLPSKDATIFDTICQGEPYVKHYYNLPPQNRIGTSTHINSFFDINACAGTVKTFLYLTVKQQFYPLYDMICQGENYTKNGFNIIQPVAGTMHDTLIFSRANNCDSVVCLALTVSHSSHSLPKKILGNTTPCSGEIETYTLPDAEHFVNFKWTVPDSVNIIKGEKTATVSLQFTDEAVADTIKLYVANGCGDGHLTLFVEPKISHYLSFVDSICAGLSYNKDGFNIPRQDTAGFYTFTRKLSTQDGCDSVRTLHLYVFPKPEVEIRSSADVICTNDSVELRVVSQMQTVDFSANIKIGDILCTDETVETPENFPISGKTAQGVIFWIDPDRTYSWVADIKWATLAMANWGDTTVLLPNVSTPSTLAIRSWSYFDTTGYQSTLAMRTYTDSSDINLKHSVAWVVDFDNGWFLPTISQARVLVANLPFIAESFVIAGGNAPFPREPMDYLMPGLSEIWRLWTSTQNTEKKAFVVSANGDLRVVSKHSNYLVRPIRYFKLPK